MSEAGQVADSVRGGTVRRQGAKPSGGAKQPKAKAVRLQLHLGELVVRRLNVHAALVGRNSSRVAEEILDGWLSRFGKGREIFTETATAQVPQATE
jgi:hypothetical protein